MMAYDITWIAEGYTASNSTIEMGTDMIHALNNFVDKMQLLYPTMNRLTIISCRIIQ